MERIVEPESDRSGTADGTPADMTTRHIVRDGVRLAYATEGAGDPALAFVHGWSCDRTYFAPQFGRFARDHFVLSMDLRGHGESDTPAPVAGRYDIEVLAGDLHAVLTEVGRPVSVLVGHSLGALVALACAVRHPEVRAVVLVDPAPITNQRARAFFGDSVDAIAADQDGSWRTRLIDGMFLGSDVVRRSSIVAGMTAVPPNIAAALVSAMVAFDASGALGRVRVPVLSIGSAFPSDRSEDLRAACPTIAIGQTVGAGHFHQLEVPEQVNSMIARFLQINGLNGYGRTSPPSSSGPW